MGRFNFPLFILFLLIAISIAFTMAVLTNWSLWIVIPISPVVGFVILVSFSMAVDFLEADKQKASESFEQQQKTPVCLGAGKPEGLKCPACHSDKIMKIIYGLPDMTKEIERQLDDKKMVLGGCLVSDNAPLWMCSACNHKFDSPPINRMQAIQIVRDIIKDFELPEGDVCIINEEATIEKDWGWLVFYTSREFFKTNDLRYAVAGNAPYIVLRKNGDVLETGTAYPIDHYIKRFEETGDPNG